MSADSRVRLGNLSLAALSIVFTLALLELAAPWLLPRLPLKLHFTLDRYQRVLAQSSKRGIVPEPPYVILLGDSYAMGLGDWLLDADADRNPPFQTAHVLQELLGRDVVSFGRSGDGSMGALVKRPFQAFRYLESTRFALPRPDVYVAFFYEGNDLEDNLRDLDGTWEGPYDDESFYDPDAFDRYLEQEWMEVGKPWRWRPTLNDRPIVFRVIRKTLTHALVGWPDGFVPHTIHPAEVNRARMQGGVVALPEPLQAAAVNLDEPELERALWTFERSLRMLHERQRDVPIQLVFVPAPVTTYPMSSPRISTVSGKQDDDTVRLRRREDVASRSDRVCGRVSAVAEELGIGFLDPRETLWPLARRQFLHGPKDWAHFNKAGYEALAGAIAPALETSYLTRTPCADVTAYFASIAPSEPGE